MYAATIEFAASVRDFATTTAAAAASLRLRSFASLARTAALSASGFFRVNAVPGESVPADAAPPSAPPSAPPAAPPAAPRSTLSATSRPFAPPPTREEQRWLERQLSDMDSAAVRSQLEASEEHAGSGGAPLSGDEQARRERRLWGCYVAMIWLLR